jgi:parallel beta-helix repeat protein
MSRQLLFLLIVFPLSAQSRTPLVSFTPGMTITHSTKIRPGHYAAPPGDSAALTIRGNDITVDLAGVELIGNPDRKHPDRFTGTAIRIDSGRNISVNGVHARGYKVGIIARGVTRLSLLNNDLSYNWKPHLDSGSVKESPNDGAGISLADITIGEIKGNTVTEGMNALLLLRSTGVRVWNNTFTYNSGVGIVMYRAPRNIVMHNRIDGNAHCCSPDADGEGSAGLLMDEQSSNNVVAYNSVPRAGDATSQALPATHHVPRLPGGMNTSVSGMSLRDRTTIIVDQWGPYDWKSPKLWPGGRDDTLPLTLRTLGPPGRWRVVSRDGVAKLSATSGRIGDAIIVTPAAGREGDFGLELEYRGAAVLTSFGEHVPAGKPVRFGWQKSMELQGRGK